MKSVANLTVASAKNCRFW